MRNKYLLSLLAALGFSGCGNNNEIWDEPCYYGPGPDWTPDIIISSQVQNEEKETINGIRVVSSYMNQEDSLITDTAYTESREIEHYTVGGIAINTFKFEEYPPKKSEMYHPPYSPPMAGFRNISPDETRKSGRTSAQTAFLGMHLTM